MEFFEFDTSFVADFGSRRTSLNRGNDSVNDQYHGIYCSTVQTLKDGGYTTKYGGHKYNCINDLPSATPTNQPLSPSQIESLVKQTSFSINQPNINSSFRKF